MADLLDVVTNLLNLITFLCGLLVRHVWGNLRCSGWAGGQAVMLAFWGGGIAGSLMAAAILALVMLDTFGGPGWFGWLIWESWNG